MTTRKRLRLAAGGALAIALVSGALTASPALAVATVGVWSDPIAINNISTFSSPPGGGGVNPGTWGSEYPRMERTGTNSWIIVYTKSVNTGYPNDANGGLQLEVATSTDNARTWTVRSTISAPGRDLDNGYILRLSDGTLLLTARSVRWWESYQLPVYRSTNGGTTWTFLSMIDQNNGSPGSLGSPDKGMYEPILFLLPDGKVSAMYANEKHVTESPSYSQTLSQRTSNDNGATWGSESYAVADTASSASRPGMPMIAQMRNGSYILVYEICGGSYGCNAYRKISTNGTTWPSGVGSAVTDQAVAPSVASLRDGRVVMTSSSSKVSISNDYGATWSTMPVSVWPGGYPDYRWDAIYQTGDDEIAVATSAVRGVGGHNIQIKFGMLPQIFEAENAVVNDAAIRTGYPTASQQSFVGGIDNAGSYVEFQRVNVSQAGTYRLSVNYANGWGSTSTHALTVNGSSAGSVSYPATAAWGTFPNVVSVDVTLNAGDNTIRLQKGTNFAEIDQISIARYEAESGVVNATRYYGVGVSPSGGGYVGGIDAAGNYVEIRGVNALVAGTYTLRVRYANGGSSATHNVTVNGSAAGSISYAPTAGWGHFASATVTVTLAAGSNTIRLQKGTNFAEVDFIEVYR